MLSSKIVFAVAICLCASSMSITPDSLVPEVLVETLPYDVSAEATSFIQAHKGDSQACINEANLALKSITDSVNGQSTGFAALGDGSQCALVGKQQIASAQSSADQAASARQAAGSELTKAGSAPVTTTFAFKSLKPDDCSQLFQSDAYTTAKTAYASAEAEVIKTEERKRLTAEALTTTLAETAESARKCHCEAQKALDDFSAEVAKTVEGNARLWKVSQKILCLSGETCKDTAAPTAISKALAAGAKEAKCFRLDNASFKLACQLQCPHNMGLSTLLTPQEREKYTQRYGELADWDLSGVTSMQHAFYSCNQFNGDVSKWDVSKVTNMEGVFRNAHKFNGDLSKWDTSKVTYMGEMFAFAKTFNNPSIDKWDVSKVTNTRDMFKYSGFNQDISKWDVSKVTQMQLMFYNNKVFNQDISNWDVSKVTTTAGMFTSSNFYQDLSKWRIAGAVSKNMFNYGPMEKKSNWWPKTSKK